MLYSALGRLRLQIGDIAGAESCFDEARALRGNSTDLREYVDRGLLAVAQNSFDEAYVCFQQASLLEPSNVMVKYSITSLFFLSFFTNSRSILFSYITLQYKTAFIDYGARGTVFVCRKIFSFPEL